jgi:hypothetical protein
MTHHGDRKHHAGRLTSHLIENALVIASAAPHHAENRQSSDKSRAYSYQYEPSVHLHRRIPSQPECLNHTSGLSLAHASTPERFSLKTFSHPAASSFSSWTPRSCPVLDTRAYPTVVIAVSYPLRGCENHILERDPLGERLRTGHSQ